MKKYNVWITLYGSSAKNVGIIESRQRTRSSWATGKLEYIPINDGSQEHYEFEAHGDEFAFGVLTSMFNTRHPSNRKPIAGRSYIRLCRAK